MTVNIVNADKSHAHLIADAIMMALGEELCESFTSDTNTLDDVRTLFTRCAESDDSQYSWRNALVAVDDNKTPLGIIVSYDGARLYELRKRFLNEFAIMHGYRIDEYMTDETTPDEYYIDSLAVFPQYRGNRIAEKLIAQAAERGFKYFGKPAALLVDKKNSRAMNLYSRLGFKTDGERSFAGEPMFHMTLNNS